MALIARFSYPGRTGVYTPPGHLDLQDFKTIMEAAQKAQTRLDAKQVASLCGMYQSGSSLADVAKRFKIHKRTASAHLRRNGIDRRPSVRKMTDAQAEAAAELRRAGWSYNKLGDYFEVDRATIKKEIAGR